VSVGGLLALYQVLGNLGHVDHFWDFDRLVEDGAPGKLEITGSHPIFVGFLGVRVYVTGMGCHPMGLPMCMPSCNV
jgi:hypothetical protein